MELTVYRQASKTRPDGTVVYKGEDALPYADGQLIMVADGLGGASAIRHTSFDKKMFDPETLPDALFSGIYDDLSEPAFADYVRDSFFELYAVKDCYTANVNNMKKSGYFASRIVSAIVLHEIMCGKKYSAETFFTAYNKERSDDKKAAMIRAASGYFTNLIDKYLDDTAEKANLVYESSYSGLSLLGTTLCAMLYRDSGKAAEVLLITAGDSRPYVWSETDGLCQLVRDEERPDGGMTNYIEAGEGCSFTINTKYMSFDKPCVIFCASDGCFDSGSFLSPMAFEKTILDAAVNAETEKDMASALHGFFTEHGRHDDSSTIAMHFCGYDSFGKFKKAAEKRLKAIEKDYLSKLAGLLTEDYIGDLERSADTAPDIDSLLRDALGNEPAVADYCTACVREEAEKLTGNDERVIKASQQRKSARESLTKLTSGLGEINGESLDRLEAAVGNVRSADSEYTDTRSGILSENIKAAAEKYWADNADALIAAMKSADNKLPAELLTAYSNTMDKVMSAAGDLEKNAAMQSVLFADYFKGYSKYLGGEEV